MTEPQLDYKPRRLRRPFYLWVLSVGLLIAGLLNGLRLAGALRNWQFYQAIGLQPGPLYLAITGGFFTLLFLSAGVGLLARYPVRRPALWLVRAAALLYPAWYWVDRLFISPQGVIVPNAPFALGATFLLAGYALLTANVLRDV